MASIFTKIIERELPAHIVAEDAHYLAFLDRYPIAKGHTLVVPKQEVAYIFDLEDSVLAGLHVFAKQVAKGLQQVVPCTRIGLAVVGLEVPHTHLHLIPIHTIGDMDSTNPKLKFTDEALAALATQVKAAMER